MKFRFAECRPNLSDLDEPTFEFIYAKDLERAKKRLARFSSERGVPLRLYGPVEEEEK